MVMLGFLAAVAWSVREGARRGISKQEIFDAALVVLIGGAVGARAMFVLLDPYQFRNPVEWFKIWEGGLSFHGCLLGGALSLIWFARKRGINFLSFLDTAAPGTALAYSIGRIGCFLNGCCYGHACALPWATRFVDPAYPGGWTPPSHPTQLYSSFSGLVIFGILAWMSKRQQYKGQLALHFFLLYSIYRFIVEYFRAGVTATFAFAGLTVTQVASIVIIALALALMSVAKNYQKRKLNAPETLAPANEPAG
jgi:phosphatidylglycerol:prolipoprotein diacylglycerol transferase